MDNLLSLSQQGINALFQNVLEDKDKLFWVRSVDFTRQLYLGKNFEIFFNEPCETIYRHPDSFVEMVLPDDKQLAKDVIRRRASFDPELTQGHAFYRSDKCGKLKFAHDQSLNIFDNKGNIVMIAGIAEFLSADKWENLQIDLRGIHNDTATSDVILDIFDRETQLNSARRQRYNSNYHAQYRQLQKSLSNRQIDCLLELLKGKSSKQIARTMQVSYRTVEGHLQKIREKTGSKNRYELFSKFQYLLELPVPVPL